METILFLTHTQNDGTLAKVSLETLGGALDLTKNLAGSKLVVGLVGQDIKAAANSIAGCGAEKFYGVSGADFGMSRYSSDAAAVEAIVKTSGATMVVAPATSRFSRVMPGVAFRVKGRIDTHVSGLQVTGTTVQINRWYYRQRMMAVMSRAQRPWFLLADSGVFEAAAVSAGTATVEPVAVTLPDTCKKTKVVGLESPTTTAQTIRPDAKVLLVAGAGWTKKQSDGVTHTKDAGKLILDFLNAIQASLGSSKSLVDQSGEGQDVLNFMSHMNQVGQTGSTPRHAKGLSTCCHGEEPHVVGWRFVKERRAVNLDANCGWAQGKTDVLYVGDAFKVMAKVNELLAKA